MQRPHTVTISNSDVKKYAERDNWTVKRMTAEAAYYSDHSHVAIRDSDENPLNVTIPITDSGELQLSEF
jgi:hypothetical protein